MPVWLMVFTVAAGSLGAGYLVARYFLHKANIRPSHKGLLLGAASGGAVFALYFVLKSFGINLFRGTPNQIFQGILVLAFLGLSARMWLLQRHAGPELADLGPSPMRTMFLGFGCLLLLIGAGSLLGGGLPVGQALVNVAQATLFLTIALTRVRISRDGILNAGGLIRWQRIARYEWRDRTILMLELHRPRWWQDRIQLPIPPEQVEQVDVLLRQHLSAPSGVS